MLSEHPNAASTAYPTCLPQVGRRSRLTNSTVSQTATAAVIAYERPSMPIQVTRGSTANTSPAASAAGGVLSRRVSTITPAVATPVMITLGIRTDSSEMPKTASHGCRIRLYRLCTMSMLAIIRPRSVSDRVATEMVYASSTHIDTRLMLIIDTRPASTLTATVITPNRASSRLGGRGWSIAGSAGRSAGG